MYVIPQAGRLANDQLAAFLAPHGYNPCALTPDYGNTAQGTLCSASLSTISASAILLAPTPIISLPPASLPMRSASTGPAAAIVACLSNGITWRAHVTCPCPDKLNVRYTVSSTSRHSNPSTLLTRGNVLTTAPKHNSLLRLTICLPLTLPTRRASSKPLVPCSSTHALSTPRCSTLLANSPPSNHKQHKPQWQNLPIC
jgi:hypothetical protein